MTETAPHPALTVGIATFNRRREVDLCIRSLLRTAVAADQWEIVVVDDGSTDGTQAYLESTFADVPLRVIYRDVNIGKANGPAPVRNIAIRQAKGETLAFLDSDFVHGNDPIAITIAHFRQFPKTFLTSAWWAHAARAHIVTKDRNMPHGAWLAARTMTWREIGGYDERFTEYGGMDNDIVCRFRRFGLRSAGAKMIALHLACPSGRPDGHKQMSQLQRQKRILSEDKTIVRNGGPIEGQT